MSVGQEPIKFILPEFVSYLGERAVSCVENDRHFCTPVLMNMSNITFEVPRLSKCSEKLHSRLNIVIRAKRVLVEIMLAQRCISIGPMYCVI